eukprot:TRINITY_DN11417_c0_g1_i1.p1 TRINITY_DN11417_c0_g1~~TRINITY_DN11417_c0_g1_i1.p1  ORF type:complete len:303 (+),score=83.26 TRINITY_DN11417_c0_g1_i1:36-944(+)
MAEEEYETETVELSIDKEGACELFLKKKWKSKYAVLSGGGIFYKSKKKDPELEGPIVFTGANIAKNDEHKKKFAISVTLNGEENLISFDDEATRKEWMEALEAGKDKEPGVGKGKNKVKQSRAMRLKKNITGSVATSAAGKGLIKEFLGKDGVRLLEIIKEIITIYEGKKQATDIENNIIKIAVKVILLWKNKDITNKDIASTIPGVKSVWSDAIDFCEMSFAYDPAKIKSHGKELSHAFSKLLGDYITEKNIEKLKYTIDYVVEEKLLNILFQDDKQEPLKRELTDILRGGWIKAFGGARQ